MIENNVLCGQCVADGLRSTVTVESAFVTAMAYRSYHDEEGRLPHHDPNELTTSYRCSQGHAFQRRTQASCWCGWPSGADPDSGVMH